MAPKELTWDQTLRFRLLEIVLQWEGRLTTNHLMTAFNIGRQQASRDINHYLTHYAPDGLVYDKSLKGYKPTDHFVPRFSEGNVDEYLMLLHREKPPGVAARHRPSLHREDGLPDPLRVV
ncbi:hypothetical protein [Aeromonas caviae]|uniref:hypothetical protein n=1 Tax=Aeromonas caviae TaxID=648 RepID=UPI002448B6B2|nr:hypothetical protein [Aeromonas caviae]MDH0241308.1 hypothetical protein [Aeromonas caviae]